MTAEFGNPASVRATGQRAAVERARGHVASAVGMARSDAVFASGATEANNLALARVGPDPNYAVLYGSAEHKSVIETRAWPRGDRTAGPYRSRQTAPLSPAPSGRYRAGRPTPPWSRWPPPTARRGEKDLCRRVGDDGRRIRPPEAFLGALAADALERDGWTKYVATTLADTPPGDWADEDGKMFHARLKGAPAKSRRLAGLHFAQVSESFAKRPGKFTAAYADGKEHGCVVPADSDKRKRVEKIADKLDSTGRRNVGRQLGSHLVCLESQVEEMAVALVFGIDVSGCPESGNYKYMAVFICTEEFLNVVVRRLQLNTVGAGSAPRKKTENPYLTLSSLIHANVLLCV